MTVTHSRPRSQHTFHIPCEGAAKKQGMDFPGDNRQGEMTSGPAAAYPHGQMLLGQCQGQPLRGRRGVSCAARLLRPTRTP